MTTNQLEFWKLEETKRANRAKEAELNRHQTKDESIRMDTNRITENLGQLNYSEQARANKAKEQELNRSNLAQERINAEKNAISLAELPIKEAQASASNLASQASMSNAITRQNELLETQRLNDMTQSIKQQQLEEQTRSNRANEGINRFGKVTDYAVASKNASTNQANAGTNLADMEERARHNRETEKVSKWSTYLDSLQLQHEIQNERAKRMAELLNNIKIPISARVQSR